MNLSLDLFIKGIVGDPVLLTVVASDPASAAADAGVTLGDVDTVLRGDLAALYYRDAHPLLLMQLAGALKVDPMELFAASKKEENHEDPH